MAAVIRPMYGYSPNAVLIGWAGSAEKKVWWKPWQKLAVRMWTIPKDDGIAWPTLEMFTDRLVCLTNEGSISMPLWVALDRNNLDNWHERTWRRHDLKEVREMIHRNGEWDRARQMVK